MLYIRSFTEAIHLVSIQFGVEDEFGYVDHLALYNGDPKAKPAQIFPKNAVLAVKEPCDKASAAGGFLIRAGMFDVSESVALVVKSLKMTCSSLRPHEAAGSTLINTTRPPTALHRA